MKRTFALAICIMINPPKKYGAAGETAAIRLIFYSWRRELAATC